jgi:hypothetical protein
MTAYQPIHRKAGSNTIPGYLLPIFIKNGPHHLTSLKVYQDGMVDCWELVSFKRFQQRVEDGWVVTRLPEGAEVFAFPLGSFVATKVKNFVTETELVKEVADAIEELNGRPTSMARCLEAYEAYNAAPSDEARERLRTAYEAMPAHNRRYVLGDMDSKDFPIRRIIYPEASGPNAPATPAATSQPTQSQPPEPKRAQVPGSLAMALRVLYQGNGLELQPLFPKSALADVEELFRDGQVDEGIARVTKDVFDALSANPNRPAVAFRVSNALSQLADYLFELGRVPESVDTHLRSLKLNPDGMSALGLAKISVARSDAGLAKTLVDTLAGFGIAGIGNEQIATALGLDIAAFKRLL